MFPSHTFFFRRTEADGTTWYSSPCAAIIDEAAYGIKPLERDSPFRMVRKTEEEGSEGGELGPTTRRYLLSPLRSLYPKHVKTTVEPFKRSFEGSYSSSETNFEKARVFDASRVAS